MEVVVYLNSVVLPSFADDTLRACVNTMAIEDAEILKVVLPDKCVVVPLICRKFCSVPPLF